MSDAPHSPEGTATEPLSRTSREWIGRVASSAMTLIVYHRDGADVVPLPPDTPLVIGREPPSDVVIADASLSRQHARFVLADGALVVEDLGSTNGTHLRGERIEEASLRPGQPVLLGRVVVSAHAHSALAPGVARIDSHEQFVSGLSQAIAEARHFGDPVSVLMISNVGDEEHVSGWCQALRSRLRPFDRMGLYSHDTVEISLPRRSVSDARAKALELVTAQGGSRGLRCGVVTFPAAGSSAERLVDQCRRALRRASDTDPVVVGASEPSLKLTPEPSDEPVVVEDSMRELFRAADRLAQTNVPVLLYGETGSGKEVVARAIHDRGPRRDHPIVCVNCGAIPAGLIESSLFGHTRGAFTGADAASPGVFGAADGGTVLLDEVGELPSAAQVALLRVLESGTMARVGSPEEIAVDVRVLAATHRDLEAMCLEGSFRRDLLYRLNVVTLSVPPLRERTQEIPLLASQFLRAALASGGRSLSGISEDAMAALMRYGWPGNVRELRNAIERAAVIATGERIELDDLPAPIASGSVVSARRPVQAHYADDDPSAKLPDRVRGFEAWAIADALRAEGGHRTRAAKRLDIPLRTLMHKIKQLGIDEPPGR